MQSQSQSQPQQQPTPSTDVLEATARAFLDVFRAMDTAPSSALFSPRFTHVFAPASVGLAALAPHTRAHLDAHLASMRTVVRAFPPVPRAGGVWVNPTLRQVTCWCDAVPEFHESVVRGSGGGGGENSSANANADTGIVGSGTGKEKDDEWAYRGEYIFVMTMDAEGKQVEHVLEFLDSKSTDRLRELMQKARGLLEEAGNQH
ncbi:hypothetical protein GGR56DRAFT_675416 [Xylariaceae sp. FL0804]|nr:hypothetical protein GGR56DRAFT_675416 [Xylariaceae sp. FL0804]